jgi:hypothetical protein
MTRYDPDYPAPILDAHCAKIVEYLTGKGAARRGVVANALGIPAGTLANSYMRRRLEAHGVTTTKRVGTGRRRRVVWLVLDGYDERTLPPVAPPRRS